MGYTSRMLQAGGKQEAWRMFLKGLFGEVGNPHPCGRCAGDALLDFDVRMAFQPIVDAQTRTVYAYEALVRGMNGEGANAVIARVRREQLYRFDQTCRVKAIVTAARLGMKARLSINFAPNAVYEPATCIRLTLAAAERCGFDPKKLIFEVTESERILDVPRVVTIIKDYQGRGFLTAIDDFGAGYAGLNLLAEFQPDLVKLDMALIRDIDEDRVRRSITSGIVVTCRSLGCQILAEVVETTAEYRVLREMGITLFQGYLFAKPALESLPGVSTELWEQVEGS
jgi:EAL domain-containing protein (putative c-di-GMP-specific phosphodiesterase class I)